MSRAFFQSSGRLALRTVYRLGYRIAPLVWRFTRPNVEGAMVAVRCGDRILFVRNSYRPEWTLPGGGVEPHEAPVEAAVRELREEIGWRVEASSLRAIGSIAFRWRHRNDHASLFLHVVETAGAVAIDGVEVVETRFLRQEEAEPLFLQPHVRHFLAALYEDPASGERSEALRDRVPLVDRPKP